VASWALAGIGTALLGLFVWAQRGWQRRQVALSRIPAADTETAVRSMDVGGLVRPWERALPWVLGFGAFALVLALTSLGTALAGAVGFLGFVLGQLVKATSTGRRALAMEVQLAEAIDHMVTSLHAGVGVLDALTTAEQLARRNLKPSLATLVSRIRLGDDPVAVCKDLARLLPLESFRLFFYALAVQWEGGGNLAPTLATTGRFIRDRVEVGRRVRAHTSEARFSVVAIIGLTYFLAALMWHLGADRVEGFLATQIGRTAAAAAIVLQALGAAWIARMSRIRF
jgi:tight adherence protein B